MAPLVEFTVLGEPAPAGSKRAFQNRSTGRIVVTDDSKRSKPWQAEVRAAAASAVNGAGPLTGPLRVALRFYRARPSGHFGTGRNAGKVKASAPAFPATRPDALKLARGVEDALTGIVWRDDAQIVDEHLEKRYGSPPRCEVRVWLAHEATGADASPHPAARTSRSAKRAGPRPNDTETDREERL